MIDGRQRRLDLSDHLRMHRWHGVIAGDQDPRFVAEVVGEGTKQVRVARWR